MEPGKNLTLQSLNQLAAEGKLIGYFNVSNEDYHAGPGISKSNLDEIVKSPAHLASRKLKKLEKTEGLIFGSQFHEFILEPHLFKYEVFEGVKKTKKDGCISEPDMNRLNAMKISLMKNRYASQCLQGIKEQAAYWIDPTTGVLCKCKVDIIASAVGMGVDLKSATNNDVLKFKWVARDRRWDVQAAFYLDGIYYASQQSGEVLFQGTLTSFMFIVVEKDPPHSLKTLLVSGNTIKRARHKYGEDLKKYKQFFGLSPNPDWKKEVPGYSEKLEILDI